MLWPTLCNSSMFTCVEDKKGRSKPYIYIYTVYFTHSIYTPYILHTPYTPYIYLYFSVKNTVYTLYICFWATLTMICALVDLSVVKRERKETLLCPSPSTHTLTYTRTKHAHIHTISLSLSHSLSLSLSLTHTHTHTHTHTTHTQHTHTQHTHQTHTHTQHTHTKHTQTARSSWLGAKTDAVWCGILWGAVIPLLYPTHL